MLISVSKKACRHLPWLNLGGAKLHARWSSSSYLKQASTFHGSCEAFASPNTHAHRDTVERRAHRAPLQIADQDTAGLVGPEDLVIVFGTTTAGDRPELVQATRFWRKGVAAFIATNGNVSETELRVGQINNEVYVTYPDSTDGRTQYPGDTRAALAPLLAHRALRGQYKWLLYGDDDTLWFMNGVLDLAGKMDSSMPYIITDAGYWHNWSKPGFHARFDEDGPLQCLPCNFPAAEWREAEGSAFTPPIACPCTTQLLCDADQRGILSKDCQMPEWFRMIHHIDGGAGALISHGLMEALDADAYEACVTSGDGIASDYLFSYCMWQSGFAPTFPSFNSMPRDIPKEHTLFNPAALLDTHHNPDRAATVANLLAAIERRESCDPPCVGRLMSMVSLHLKAQHTANMQSGIFLLRSISGLYDSFLASNNKTGLTKWPLVRFDKSKEPSSGWDRKDVPVMQKAFRKYDFGLLNEDHPAHLREKG
ncbi:hypothetical protein WJX84_011487 [Apatococcus fuscideae]|uniref:Uncharacterized protein n=1 Tax=Apatococcus fuscideae TaxID=2026836 RepID=A0AAW1SW64_9CHLO